MTASPERGFGAPPLWEMAVSVWSDSPLFDGYDVREVHDLFRQDLPRFERHPPLLHLPIAAFAGGPPPISHMENGFPPRWWFISDDGRDLLQLQEQFIATNWRRLTTIPGEGFSYPGFDIVVAKAKRRVDRLAKFWQGRGKELTAPAACELLYNNVIPLELPDGTRLAISDVLSEYRRAEERKVAGFEMTWMEAIDSLGVEDKSTLHVETSVVGVPIPEREPMPVVRIQFVAGAVRQHWDEVFTFFEVAHTHIRRRLMALTTTKAHETWLPR